MVGGEVPTAMFIFCAKRIKKVEVKFCYNIMNIDIDMIYDYVHKYLIISTKYKALS